MSTKDQIEQSVAEITEAKKKWPEGPWQAEPDRVEWRSETGLPCLITRNLTGNLCGYVAVPPGHALHGKEYGDTNFEVHGGLTFSDKCTGSVCHVPAPGEPEDVWWFGFDCAHGFDLMPGFAAHFGGAFLPGLTGVYRDLAYVTAEVNQLAAQIERYAAVKAMR